MRLLVSSFITLGLLAGVAKAADQPKQAPKVTLQSPDGKQSYDLAKLVNEGPVLVRLTCACSGCDQELPFFQKLQASYNTKGLKTIAVFKEKPEELSQYVVKKDIKFMWLADPKGELWKTFEAATMPTNILFDKGGRVVKMLPGCTKDGKNAQAISEEVAKLLKADVVKVAEGKSKSSK